KTAYTQGLEFYRDTLYESTGLKGKSSLRKVDFKTGEVYKQIALDQVYFGEGISILNDKLYQLTWQGNMGFQYQPDQLKMERSFSYQNSKEGWGLCNDRQRLYKSDGTHQIWILDPQTQKEMDKIQVMTDKNALKKINELEWVDGKIYANTYQFKKEVGIIIDPQSGAVEGVIDFSGLKSKVEQVSNLDVLNGIAYHPKRKTFFVTGKNWSKLFEVKILPKE
ncbi:MAG: glutaminyl-peptide cyclotransferase, partial [Flavobacteriaceae bacterium]